MWALLSPKFFFLFLTEAWEQSFPNLEGELGQWFIHVPYHSVNFYCVYLFCLLDSCVVRQRHRKVQTQLLLESGGSKSILVVGWLKIIFFSIRSKNICAPPDLNATLFNEPCAGLADWLWIIIEIPYISRSTFGFVYNLGFESSVKKIFLTIHSKYRKYNWNLNCNCTLWVYWILFLVALVKL